MTITKDIKNRAEQLFKKMPDVDKFFVNAKGEFFTREDLCKLSKEKYTAIERVANVEEDKTETPVDLKSLSKDEVEQELKPLNREKLEAVAEGLEIKDVKEFPNKKAIVKEIIAVLFPEKEKAAEEGAAEE